MMLSRPRHDLVVAAHRSPARSDRGGVSTPGFAYEHTGDPDEGLAPWKLGYGVMVVRAVGNAWALLQGPDDVVARRIADVTPARAIVARLDSEALCIGLPVLDELDALASAERVVEAFATPLSPEAGPVRVNVGVAVRRPGALRSTAVLLHEARTALAHACRLGPACALLFDDSMIHRRTHVPCRRRKRRPCNGY